MLPISTGTIFVWATRLKMKQFGPLGQFISVVWYNNFTKVGKVLLILMDSGRSISFLLSSKSSHMMVRISHAKAKFVFDSKQKYGCNLVLVKSNILEL